VDKLGWVLLPIVLAGLWAGWRALRGRPPSRQTLNVASSLLLLAYVAATAGLGIFWVANQQLPVFDWHYLFGYAVVGLVVVHLVFNFRVVWAALRRRRPAAVAPAAAPRRPLLGAIGWAGIAAAGGIGFFVGQRQGRTELRLAPAPPRPEDGAWAVVERFHEASSHSRVAALRRAPSADWGGAPPPFKPLAGGTARALPPPAAAMPAGAAFDMAALGSVLWHSAGVSLVRGGLHLRTAPSSGALFATELYIVARRVAGLAPGLWHYAPRQHALGRMAGGAGAVLDAALDRAIDGAGAVGDAPAVVIATALFRRSGHKYGDRTYRYVLADLGHALENLHVAAAAAGLAVRFAPRFDEARISALLGVDEQDEGVLAVAVLHATPAAGAAASNGLAAGPAAGPATGPATGSDNDPAAVPAAGPATSSANDPATGPASGPGPGAWRPAPLLDADRATLGLTEAVHRATSLRRSGDSAPRPPAGAGPPVAPGPIAADAAAWRARIARRRSIRRYAETAVARADLDAVLAAMAAPGPRLSNAVRIRVLTPAVRGLPPGVWRYEGGALVAHDAPAGELRRRARAAALDQDVIGDAAVVFVLAIDRAVLAADPDGPARGWRHAFVEAGMVGERVYLEGVARGLGVCGVGAFHDDEALRLVGGDPRREWVVHFVALGVPA
jgi:SagB-type dehydrogenase family enzyme